MKQTDFKRFAVAWQAAQKVYGKTADADVISLCFRVLSQYELADIENALGAHLQDGEGGQYAPRPADIVRKLEGSKDSQVALAWADFRQATRSGEMPDDPALQQVIRRLGGLEFLGDKKSRDLDFMREQFAAMWLAADEPERLGIAHNKPVEALGVS